MADKPAERDNTNKDGLSRPWSRSEKEIADALNVYPEYGLNTRRVEKRHREFGRNILQKVQRRSALAIFINQWDRPRALLLPWA